MKIVIKAMRTTTGWEELLGTGCHTDKEREVYIELVRSWPTDLSPAIELVPDDFECGPYVEEKPNVLSAQRDPEQSDRST